MAIRVDKLIGELMRAAEAQVGAGRVLVVLTADHGVAPVPEVNQKRKMPGGRLNPDRQRDAVEKALRRDSARGHWVADMSEGIFLNTDTIGRAECRSGRGGAGRRRGDARVAAYFPRVYADAVDERRVSTDPVDVRVRNGFNAARSGNLIVIPDPYWMAAEPGTTHGAPFDYDAHVPMLFLGAQCSPGATTATSTVNDIAADARHHAGCRNAQRQRRAGA